MLPRVLILALFLGGAPDGGPDAPPPASNKARVHVGLFEAATPGTRPLAVEVSNQAVALGQKRSLAMSQLAPETMNDPARSRHEGALLKCLNPWSPRREVIRCVQELPFPPTLDPPPEGTQFVITGFITPSDEGLVIDAMLAPMINGEPGVPVASRSVVVPFRGKRALRIKQIGALISPLLDAAEGLPPHAHETPPPPPTKKRAAEEED